MKSSALQFVSGFTAGHNCLVAEPVGAAIQGPWLVWRPAEDVGRLLGGSVRRAGAVEAAVELCE